jgi:hypothetical protein
MTNTQYTSPLTGKTYDVVYNGAKSYAPYEIFLNGKWVQFGLTLDDVAGSVANYEGRSDGWVSSPRD